MRRLKLTKSGPIQTQSNAIELHMLYLWVLCLYTTAADAATVGTAATLIYGEAAPSNIGSQVYRFRLEEIQSHSPHSKPVWL
jgi:hypothetical protein